MTTKELIAWICRAQDIKEKSWSEQNTIYTKSTVLCLREAMDVNLSIEAVEFEIAYSIFVLSFNEVQTWNTMFHI